MESNSTNNQNSLRPPSGSSSPSKASTMRKFRLAVPQNAEGGFKLKISSPAGQQSQGNLSAKSSGMMQITNGSTLSTSVADSQAFQTVTNSRLRSPNLAEASKANESKDMSYLSEPSMDAASSPTKIQLKKDSIKTISKHEGQVFQHANRSLFKSSDGRQSAEAQPNNIPQGGNSRGRDNSKGALISAGDQIASPRDFGPMQALAQLANIQKQQQNNQVKERENSQNLRQSADDKMMTLKNLNNQLQGQNNIIKSRSPNTSQTILPLINNSGASNESPDMPKKKPLVIRLKSNNNSQNRTQNTGLNIMATQVTQGMPNLLQVQNGPGENQRYTQRANARADSCEQTINNTNIAMAQMALFHQQNMQMQQDAQKFFMTQQGFRDDGNYQRGVVSATKGSRTGILAKNGKKAIYQPFTPQKKEEDDGTSLPSMPNLQSQNRQGTNESQIRSPSKNARGKSKGMRGEGSNTRNIMPTKLTPLRFVDHDSLGSLGSFGSGDGAMNTVPLGKLSYGGKSRGGSHDRVLNKAAMNIQKEGLIDEGPMTEDREQKGPLPKIKLKGKNVTLKSGGPKNGQPFDFNYIKVLIKKGGSDKEQKEVFVDRDWVSKNNNIPHFSNVIKNVDRGEGVEITMNCNCDAFKWIIDFVKIKTNGDDEKEELHTKSQFVSEQKLQKIDSETELKLEDELDNITNESCLNVMVTAYFLQLFWVYHKVWDYYFSRSFSEVINNCKISLSNINQAIVKDIANRISDTQLESMTERKDKFISNVYKARIEQRIQAIPESQESLRPEGEYKGNRFVLPEAEVVGQDLFWCANCQMVLTKAQAMTISCIEQKTTDKSITQSSSQSKLINPMSEDDPSEQIMETYRDNTDQNQQDSIINKNGEMFYYHDIVFPEEVPYLASDLLEAESNFQISSTEPMATENFIKFFREKYRLCWKEIYLKFAALMYMAEKCKHCRENFQLTQIAGCTGQTDQNFTRYATQPFQLEKEYIQHQKMESLRFHEVDIDSKLVDSKNFFTNFHYRMFKTQFQVTDSLSFPLETNSSSMAIDDSEKKYFDHHKSLIESYKEAQLEFVEPQSMNYDIKINQAYQEFLKQDKMKVSKQEQKLIYSSGLNTSQSINKKSVNVGASVDLINKAGQKLETVEEQGDDIMYRCSNHQIKINKKLQDSKFMKKLYKQCEEYILDNPQEFAKNDVARAKFDFADQKMIENKGRKKKGQEGELDPHQAAACQALVIKKFKRTKKNIMYQEDINSMEILENYLLKIRKNSTDRDFNIKSNNVSSQRNNSNSHRQNNQQRGNSPVGPQNRFRSPVGKVDNIKLGNQTNQNCELFSQSGVKIYSDIKQITVKKTISLKKSGDKSSIPASGGAARKNFLQRNIARSQGARSGSNHHNTNAPTIQQDNQDNQSVGTPVQKQRHVQQNNSASRIQTQGLTIPLNQQSVHQRHQNFMNNQSQDQILADQVSPHGITQHGNFQQAVNQAINQDVQKHPQRYMRSPNPGISGQNLTNLQGITNAQANLQNLKSNLQVTSAGMNSLQLPQGQNLNAVNNSQQLLNIRSNSGNPTQSAGPARGSNRSPQLKINIRPGNIKLVNPPQSQGQNQQ